MTVYTADGNRSFNIMAEAVGCKMNFPEDDVPSVAKGLINKIEDIDNIELPDPYSSPRLALHLETLKLIRKTGGNPCSYI